MVDGPSMWEVGTWIWYKQVGPMWVLRGPQFLTPEKPWEVITCKLEARLDPDNNR
jgi:hypothetical protein